jgi:hypothetical protein
VILSFVFATAYGLNAQIGYSHTDAVGVNWSGANAAISNSDLNTLSQGLHNTGANWVRLGVLWMWSEANAPTANPKYSTNCYAPGVTGLASCYGPTVKAYHNYDFSHLDQVVSAISAFPNINIMVTIANHPTWAGGQSCNAINSFPVTCGIIYSSHKQIFKDNWGDFVFNIVKRYPSIKWWALWNEPNLPGGFSPQDPINATGIVSEYMDDIQFPGYNNLKAANPGANAIGPELFIPSHTSNDVTCDYWNHCLSWELWTQSLLQYFDKYVATFSFHYYDNDGGHLNGRINQIWNGIIVPLGKQRQIWITEFNFFQGALDGTCAFNEQFVALEVGTVYAYMPNQRAFFFSLADNPGGCTIVGDGNGLLRGPDYSWEPKSFLYPYFQKIDIPLLRYYNGSNHWVSTGAVPSGYSLERNLGFIYYALQGGTRALYSCSIPGTSTDQFVSLDVKCEGQTPLSTIGYIYFPQPSGIQTVAVYRCRDDDKLDHFMSTDPFCEGEITENNGVPLGYAKVQY